MKLSVKQQRELLPDDSVKKIFMARDDIKKLPKSEREKRWKKHLKAVDNFRELLSDIPCIGIIQR